MDARTRSNVFRIAVVPVLLALLVALWPVLHLGRLVAVLRADIAALGPAAPLVYALAEGVTMPLVLPALPFTIGAAALFGPALGLAVVVVGSNIGAALCFLIARYVARDAVVDLLGGREEFRRVDRIAAKHGAHAVALVRLIPFSPFEVASYMFGLTAVPFRTYALWTAVASVPGAALWVLGASTIIEAAVRGHFSLPLLAVFAVTLLIVIVLARIVARDIKE